MKQKLSEKLLHKVADVFPRPRLQVSGDLLFKAPIDDVLCGLCIESSGFSADVFHPSIFVQPMFKKSESLVLSLGERLLGNWNVEDEGVVERLIQQVRIVGLPFWDKYGTTEKLAALPTDPRLPLRAVTAGYALILCRRFDEAARTLEFADKHLSSMYCDQMKANPSFWPNMVHSEVMEMLTRVRSDSAAAIETLTNWRQFTLESLKLFKYANESPASTSC